VADATLSYLSIAMLGIAAEGNPALAGLAEHIGFGWTMVLRTALGLALIGGLFAVALRAQTVRDQRATLLGLRVVAILMVALTAYHGLILVLAA
jgi:hypothetical protein